MTREAKIKAKLQRIRDHRAKREAANASSITTIGNKRAVFTYRRERDKNGH